MTDEKPYERKTKVFKALSDSNRLMIIEVLQTGERCGCEILEDLNIGQSTLSHHLKILIGSGLVGGRREGKWTYYSLSEEGCQEAKKLLNELVAVKGDNRNSVRKCD